MHGEQNSTATNRNWRDEFSMAASPSMPPRSSRLSLHRVKRIARPAQEDGSRSPNVCEERGGRASCRHTICLSLPRLAGYFASRARKFKSNSSNRSLYGDDSKYHRPQSSIIPSRHISIAFCFCSSVAPGGTP